MDIESNILLAIFKSAQRNTKCPKFYCSTCGGLFAATEDVLKSVSNQQIVVAFSSPVLLGLRPRDFRYRTYQGEYPREPNISPYAAYLKSVFYALSYAEQNELASTWLTELCSWPSWLQDGISYYFASELQGEAKARWGCSLHTILSSSQDASLRETLRLKFF